jgi:hypothetical protein
MRRLVSSGLRGVTSASKPTAPLASRRRSIWLLHSDRALDAGARLEAAASVGSRVDSAARWVREISGDQVVVTDGSGREVFRIAPLYMPSHAVDRHCRPASPPLGYRRQ